MKREAVELHGVPPERVVVTGAQPFDHWFDWQPCSTRAAVLRAGRSAGADSPTSSISARRGSSRPTRCRSSGGGSSSCAPRVAGAARRGRADPARIRRTPISGTTWTWAATGRSSSGRAPAPRRPTARNRADYFDSIYHSAGVVGVNTTGGDRERHRRPQRLHAAGARVQRHAGRHAALRAPAPRERRAAARRRRTSPSTSRSSRPPCAIRPPATSAAAASSRRSSGRTASARRRRRGWSTRSRRWPRNPRRPPARLPFWAPLGRVAAGGDADANSSATRCSSAKPRRPRHAERRDPPRSARRTNRRSPRGSDVDTSILRAWWNRIASPLSRVAAQLGWRSPSRRETGLAQPRRTKEERDRARIDGRAQRDEVKRRSDEAREARRRSRLDGARTRGVPTSEVSMPPMRPTNGSATGRHGCANADDGTSELVSDAERRMATALAPLWHADRATVATLRRWCDPLNGAPSPTSGRHRRPTSSIGCGAR